PDVGGSRRVSPEEDSVRVAVVLGRVRLEPRHGLGEVLNARGPLELGRQAIVDGHADQAMIGGPERHVVVGERARRMFGAAAETAAMNENQHGFGGTGRAARAWAAGAWPAGRRGGR